MVHVSLRSNVVSFSFLLLNGVLVFKVMGRGILIFVLGIYQSWLGVLPYTCFSNNIDTRVYIKFQTCDGVSP